MVKEKKKFIYILLVVISFFILNFINLKILYCEVEETRLEQSKDKTTPKDVPKAKEPLTNNKYNVNFFILIAKALFSLLIITALIYFILRFFLKGQRWITRQQKFIQTIATCPLTPNKYIQIVELGNRLLVLGISEHNINLLTEIVDKETIDFIKTQSSKEVDEIPLSFIQHLKKRFAGGEIEQEDLEHKLKFLDKQRQRLKKLEL